MYLMLADSLKQSISAIRTPLLFEAVKHTLCKEEMKQQGSDRLEDKLMGAFDGKSTHKLIKCLLDILPSDEV